MRSVKAFAPATVANVSCGFDILGFAIDAMGDTVELVLKDEPGLVVVSIDGDGGKLPLEAEKNTCAVAIQAMLDELDSKVGMNIYLTKGLPLGSGMGSSAASAVAALAAANRLLGDPFEKKDLLPFAIAAKNCRFKICTERSDSDEACDYSVWKCCWVDCRLVRK